MTMSRVVCIVLLDFQGVVSRIVFDEIDSRWWPIEIKQAYIDIGIPRAANVAHVNGHGDDVGIVRVDVRTPQCPPAYDLDAPIVGEVHLRDAHHDGGIHLALEPRKWPGRFDKGPPSGTCGRRYRERWHIQQPAQIMTGMGGGRLEHVPCVNHHRRFRHRKTHGNRRGERGGESGVIQRRAIVHGRAWRVMMVMVMVVVMWRMMSQAW